MEAGRTEKPMLPSTTNTPKLRRICLRVRDPKRSARFYQAVLGLESVDCPTNGGATYVLGSPGTRPGFEVVFTEGLPPGDHLTGLDRVSFEASSRACVDYIYEEARRRHARATQPRLYEGHWQTFIFDPDGYKVEVFTRAQNGPVCPSRDSKTRDQGGRSSPGDTTV
jgi:catechol 2,3-dioxygenase-like lactoylglutathione lyase family enzyme